VKSAKNIARKFTDFSGEYQAALRTHLKQNRPTSLRAAKRLGLEAISTGVQTLDVARIHDQALIKLVLSDSSSARREAMARRGGAFFAEAITPIEQTHRLAQETQVRMDQLNEILRQRSAALAASRKRLEREVAQRELAEAALLKSEQHYGELLEQSSIMQNQLRLLSRQLLLAQEEERKKISRELHDVIAQTLTTINLRLASLKNEATLNTKGLLRSIARTQKLVERSVNIVHRFARELRPTVLDDLGLIPALHTFMKNFREQTGLRVSLSAFAEVEQVNGDKRTVLYRVAQEALTNIGRHARASQAHVKIQKLDGAVCMRIRDNGKGFQEAHVLRAKKSKRLGLLGMRERLEMVGGSFTVTSKPGKATTVLAQIPLLDRKGGGSRNRAGRVRQN
jgi:signal transduction histidine kinase